MRKYILSGTNAIQLGYYLLQQKFKVLGFYVLQIVTDKPTLFYIALKKQSHGNALLRGMLEKTNCKLFCTSNTKHMLIHPGFETNVKTCRSD